VKTVEFISISGQDEVAVPDVGLVFNLYVTSGRNAKIQTVSDEDAEIILTNPNFRDVTPAPAAPAPLIPPTPNGAT
jgi:hypothetical protein